MTPIKRWATSLVRGRQRVRFDPARRVLVVDGEPVPLRPKSASVLGVLLEANGELGAVQRRRAPDGGAGILRRLSTGG